LRYIILFLLPLLLSANITYLTTQNKEISILDSFDIDASFLYDPIMNEMKNSKKDSEKQHISDDCFNTTKFFQINHLKKTNSADYTEKTHQVNGKNC